MSSILNQLEIYGTKKNSDSGTSKTQSRERNLTTINKFKISFLRYLYLERRRTNITDQLEYVWKYFQQDANLLLKIYEHGL